MEMVRVVVASKNPVKIKAVEQVFASAGFDARIEGVSARSGVADQPMGSDETYLGACNRIEDIKLKHPDAHFWVGIEGGIEVIDGTMHCMAWIVISSKDLVGSSKVASFVLPKCVTDLVEQGSELGDATAEYFKEPNSKQKMGVVGILTGGTIDRTSYYVHAGELAMIPFRNINLYC